MPFDNYIKTESSIISKLNRQRLQNGKIDTDFAKHLTNMINLDIIRFKVHVNQDD